MNSLAQAFHARPPIVDLSRNTTLAMIAGGFMHQVREVWQPDQINEYLLATDGRRHVWHSWLGGQDAASGLAESYEFLTRSKSSDILADVYHVENPVDDLAHRP